MDLVKQMDIRKYYKRPKSKTRYLPDTEKIHKEYCSVCIMYRNAKYMHINHANHIKAQKGRAEIEHSNHLAFKVKA